MTPLDVVTGEPGARPRLGDTPQLECVRLKQVEALFAPWSVVVEASRIGTDTADLHPEEDQQMANAVPERRLEFATGRRCARRALSRLRIESFALKNGPDRAPRWPAGIVGSITHTATASGGYCAVVIGRKEDLATVGIDVEPAAPLEATLWSTVLTPSEHRWIDTLPGAARGLQARAIFSAKECFYKAQYPLSGRFLDFQDVEIAFHPASSRFEVQARPSNLPFSGCVGHYMIDDAFILSGIALPRQLPT